jgi:hypothetical protein
LPDSLEYNTSFHLPAKARNFAFLPKSKKFPHSFAANFNNNNIEIYDLKL